MLTEESAISSLKWSVLQKTCIPVFLVAPCTSYTHFRRLSLGCRMWAKIFWEQSPLSRYIFAHVPRKNASVPAFAVVGLCASKLCQDLFQELPRRGNVRF